MASSGACKNCGTVVEESFCSQCGQRVGISKITFKETFQDFVDTVFSVNAPLMRTIKLLFINPGKLFREYLNGRRKTYYKPVSFFIMTTIVYLLLRSLISYDPMEGTVIRKSENINGQLFLEAGHFMVKNINNIMFLFVFTLALFSKAFFYGRNNLAEFTAISFYTVGVYSLIGTLIMFYLKYVDANYKMLPAFVFLVYLICAYISFFTEKRFIVFIKTLIMYCLAFVFYAAIGYAISLLIVWIRGN